MLLLLPCDPLDPRRADGHFAPEGVAARSAGVPVALVDHDALVAGRHDDGVCPACLAGVDPQDLADAVYRGWMLDASAYAAMAHALTGRGVSLRTSPEQYRGAHEIPGWAAVLSAVTPATVVTQGFSLEELAAAGRDLGTGPAVLRDHVKSLKHHGDDAFLVLDAADAAGVEHVGRRFVELREGAAIGGFVLRRFETFVSAEVRTWWVAGRCALVTAHPDTPGDLPHADGPDAVSLLAMETVAAALAHLELPFVTVDLVRRDDGIWRVVELGDGQVSDLPSSTSPDALVTALV